MVSLILFKVTIQSHNCYNEACHILLDDFFLLEHIDHCNFLCVAMCQVKHFPKANIIIFNAFRDCYAYNHAELPTKVTSSTPDRKSLQ